MTHMFININKDDYNKIVFIPRASSEFVSRTPWKSKSMLDSCIEKYINYRKSCFKSNFEPPIFLLNGTTLVEDGTRAYMFSFPMSSAIGQICGVTSDYIIAKIWKQDNIDLIMKYVKRVRIDGVYDSRSDSVSDMVFMIDSNDSVYKLNNQN